MIEFIKNKWKVWQNQNDKCPGNEAPQYTQLKADLSENLYRFNSLYENCSDFILKQFVVCGQRAAAMMMDNMIDKVTLSESVLNPLTTAVPPNGIQSAEDKFVWLRDYTLSAIDQKEIFTVEDCVARLMAGFVIILYDGVARGLSIGLQAFPYRSISEPSTERVLRGSREGFVEALHINLSMLRRRIRNPALKFEPFYVGNDSKTEICVTYIEGIASETVVSELKRKINHINLDSVMASGYIQSYLESQPSTIFPTVGTTERPDTLCAKMEEGRVGVIVDGTPVALIVPFLFVENFQNIDDYAVGPYYATFTRIIKFIGFFISFLLPALYVAIGSYQQSLLPSQLLFTLAKAEEATPFSLLVEALIIQLFYEMLREGGLRLPKQMGFAINIVGAFVIGQSAVSAGIIGAPMVIILALTATTSFVVPTLYEPSVLMRFGFIFLAGISGLYGVLLGCAFLVLHVSSIKSYDVPYSSPLSPFRLYAMRDMVVRAPWQILSQKKAKIQDMPGSNVDKNLNL